MPIKLLNSSETTQVGIKPIPEAAVIPKATRPPRGKDKIPRKTRKVLESTFSKPALGVVPDIKRGVAQTKQALEKARRESADPERDIMVKRLEKTQSMTTEQVLKAAADLPNTPIQAKMTPEEFTAERMVLAYRLSIRGLSDEQISQQMQLGLGHIKKMMEVLKAKLRLDPKTLNVGYYMGESLAFYQEIRQMALLTSSNDKASTSEKMIAMKIALSAEESKNNFLARIGVYSPTVVARIERWVVNTADDMIAPQAGPAVRVNIAAEIGRQLSKRAPVQEFSGVEDVEYTEKPEQVARPPST